MRTSAPLWLVSGLILGLAAGFLAGSRTPPRRPPAAPSAGAGGVLQILLDPELDQPAAFVGSMRDADNFCHTYTFAREGDARRAAEAARKALLAEYRRALDGGE